MIYIILIIVGVVIGFIPTFFIMKKHNFELDQSKLNELKKQEESYANEIIKLQEERVNLLNDIQNLENEAKQYIRTYYEENYKKINEKLNNDRI